jgi:hypothetical protein
VPDIVPPANDSHASLTPLSRLSHASLTPLSRLTSSAAALPTLPTNPALPPSQVRVAPRAASAVLRLKPTDLVLSHADSGTDVLLRAETEEEAQRWLRKLREVQEEWGGASAEAQLRADSTAESACMAVRAQVRALWGLM